MVERRAELEAAIEADPYDPRAFAVYGDYLQELGDPRGELIALHLANAADPDPRLDTAARAFFRRHPNLLPPFSDRSRATWRNGFVSRAETHARFIEDVIDHPSNRFLIQLGIFWNPQPQRAVDVLAAHVRPALRELVLSRASPELAHEDDDDPLPIADLSSLWSQIPNLVRLRVQHGRVVPGALDLPRLVEIELDPYRLHEQWLDAIAGGSLPALERVDLAFAMSLTWEPAVVDGVRRLLVEARPAKLQHLGLRRARNLLPAVLQANPDVRAAFEGLRSLDLSGSSITDEELQPLLECGLRLERLDVSRNQLTVDAIRALSDVATTVIAEDQSDPTDQLIEGLYDY